MIRQSVRRVWFSSRYARRIYHNSAVLGVDALDMVDTFARRHSKFNFALGFSLTVTSYRE
jgi:hypothetical protein